MKVFILFTMANMVSMTNSKKLFPSINPKNDWIPDWQESRILNKSYQVDPLDPQAMMRGSGSLIFGNGELRMQNSPRLYVTGSEGRKWRNVELTAYASLSPNTDLSAIPSYAGITFATRSNHHDYTNNPCNARGYYGKLWFSTGEVGVQKEMYHGSTDSDLGKVTVTKKVSNKTQTVCDPRVTNCNTIYTSSKRSSERFSTTAYVGKFFGIKFVVRDDGLKVRLEIYTDITEGLNGGDWKLSFTYVDEKWPALKYESDENFPCIYEHTPPGIRNFESPILDGGTVSFLRTTNSDLTWKGVSFREIEPLCMTPVRGKEYARINLNENFYISVNVKLKSTYNSWTNILHVGKLDKPRIVSIFIEKQSTKISFRYATTRSSNLICKINSNTGYLTLNKQHKIEFSIQNGVAKGFVDGIQVCSRNLGTSSTLGAINEPLFISSPYFPASDACLTNLQVL